MDLQQGKTQASAAEESNILERVARLISSVRGVKPDYSHLAAELEPALPFDLFGVVLLRYDRQAVRVTLCQREGERWTAHYHQLPLADSMMERVSELLSLDGQRQTGMDVEERADERAGATGTLLVENFPDGASGLPAQCGDALFGHPQLQAILVAPLIAGGNILGTLELGSTRLDAYADPALRRLIRAIASVLATAIENAQAGGNVEIQDRQRADLKDVSTVLTTAVDLPMILNRIVTGITNALHVSSAIVRYDRRQRTLALEAQSELDAALLQRVLRRENVTSEESIIGATLLRRQAQVAQDIAQDEHFPQSQAFASELSVRSLFCYPLIVGQYVYGALLLLSPEPGGFTPLKTDIFSLFAGQATVAIHTGLLLQSAQERRRFQEVIEQFERSSQRNVFTEQSEANEQELLARLREETLNTFGVSLGSVLRFISDHLLTRSDRHLQAILRSSQMPSLLEEKSEAEVETLPEQDEKEAYGEEPMFLAHLSEIEELARSTGQESAAFLVQAADAALARTNFLRDISAALMRVLRLDEAQPEAYEQLKRELAEPWFIVDLDGHCIYLNRAAELFCEMGADLESTRAWGLWPEEQHALFSSFRPLLSRQEATLTLEQALTPLFPRVRHLNELLAYLREFTVRGEASAGQNDVPLPTFLRCTLAAEPLPGQVALGQNAGESGQIWSIAEAREPRAVITPPTYRRSPASPTLLLESSPSDHHYQFVRHALYNEAGQWFANALHVRNITEQVRDEKNKAVLLASVSHDLRTPLTTIKAAVTGLLQSDVAWDEETRREILEDIDAETDHLHTLVNALVEMSRIEMGALTLDKEWCDIVELVYNTLNRTQRLLADFNVQTQVQSPLPLIYADYAQLERVLYNLLENATRHSPRHAQIRILVDVLGQHALPHGLPETTSRGIRVRVIDQGPGIPEEERERVFKSFYSLDAQGNGLGLAICRGIIEGHQGRIWVEADKGCGACFVFVLPVTS